MGSTTPGVGPGGESARESGRGSIEKSREGPLLRELSVVVESNKFPTGRHRLVDS